MPINTNDLILKVTSRISDVVDGDTVLLIEQSIPTSIARVTKRIAEMKPRGHELLLKEQNVTQGVLGDSGMSGYTGYKKFDLNNAQFIYPVVVDGVFHALHIKDGDGTYQRAFPMKSLSAIGLSTTHQKICYFVEYPYVYVSYHQSGFIPTAGADTVKLTHYAYLPLSEFPEELEDFLVDDLLVLLQAEAQKQMMEQAKPNV